MKISRSAISELENGKRKSISIAEVFILAAALDVPPVLLVFPQAWKQLHPKLQTGSVVTKYWNLEKMVTRRSCLVTATPSLLLSVNETN